MFKKFPILVCCLVVILVAGCDFLESNSNSTGITLNTLSFPETPEALLAECDAAIKTADEEIAVILATERKTFRNTVHAVNDVLHGQDKRWGLSFTVSDLSTDAALRDAAREASLKYAAWNRQVFYNGELYDALRKAAANTITLAGEDRRLFENIIKEFERNGIALNFADRRVLEEIENRIEVLETEFQRNVTNFNQPVHFSAGELEGLPSSALNALDPDPEGGYWMDPRLDSHYGPVIGFAVNEAARRKAYVAYFSVAARENPPILEELVQLRAKKAGILGYDTHADFVLANRMAKTTDTAIDFLQNLSDRLEGKFQQENQTLLDLKIIDTNNPDAVLHPWDLDFYKRLYTETHFDLDEEAMKKYFSMENCLEGMFDIFEEVFGLVIVARNLRPEELWHEDVRLFQVNDAATGDPLGLFYLDLYPREGKYTHFATSFTYLGNTYSDGRSERPTAVLFGNWPEPKDETPSLLSFYEVETLFHEFGHVLNMMLMQPRYSRLWANAWDFVEIPSQMAEQWVSEQSVLDRFAVNYQERADRLPDDFMEKKKAARQAFIANWPRGILSRAMTDLELHTRFTENDAIDVVQVGNDIRARYYLPIPGDTAWIARFTHLVGGYDAGYYSYLWSLAIVYDLADAFEHSSHGFMDPALGLRLRQEIYEPGAGRDEADSVTAFLGRDWNIDAWLKHLGI